MRKSLNIFYHIGQKGRKVLIHFSYNNRKLMKEELTMLIYKITNTINNKCYIGQSQNLYKRFLDYKKGRFSPHLKKSVEI